MTVGQAPQLKLGKRPAIPARPRLRLRDVLISIPDHPVADTDVAPLIFGMDLNDRIGDCVVAAKDHLFQRVKTALGLPYTPMTTDELVADYSTQNPGFDINAHPDASGNLPNDNGMVIQMYLELLRKRGEIVAFAEVDHTSDAEVQAAIYIFLSLWCGANIQQAQMDQFNAGQPWDFVEGSEVIGGHSFTTDNYTTPLLDDAVTWGKAVDATANFVRKSIDELWVPILPEHRNHPGYRANIDDAKLCAIYHDLTGDTLPPLPAPTPTPTPPPAPAASPDQTFAETLRPWVLKRHEGGNHHVALAAKAWLTAKGL